MARATATTEWMAQWERHTAMAERQRNAGNWA